MNQEFPTEDRIELISRCKHLLTHHGRLYGRAQGSAIVYYRVEDLQLTEFRRLSNYRVEDLQLTEFRRLSNKHGGGTIKLHVLEGSTYPANQVTASVLFLHGDDPYRAEWSNLELAPRCLAVLRRHMVLEDLSTV